MVAGRSSRIVDLRWAVAFCAHLGVLAIVLVSAGASSQSTSADYWLLNKSSLEFERGLVVAAPVVALLAAVAWITLFRQYRDRMDKLVRLSYGVCCLLLVGLVPLYLGTSPSHWAIGLLVLAVIAADTMWVLAVKDQLQFVSMQLDLVCDQLREQGGTGGALHVTFALIGVQTLFLVCWGLTMVSPLHHRLLYHSTCACAQSPSAWSWAMYIRSSVPAPAPP